MAFIKSKKVYAILMNDNDGRKIVEQVNDLTQPELDKKIDEFFNSHSGATENPEIANTRQEEGGEDYTLEIEKENIGKDEEGEKATDDYVKELFEKGLTKDEIIDILREDKEYADLPVPKAIRNSLDNLGMAEWIYGIPEMVETIEEQFGLPKKKKNKEYKSSITHPEYFDGDIDFNETADLNTNYPNGEVDYLSNTYLSRIYDMYNGNEDAMIRYLRQFDTGVSNGDMQGIVEAFVMKKNKQRK